MSAFGRKQTLKKSFTIIGFISRATKQHQCECVPRPEKPWRIGRDWFPLLLLLYLSLNLLFV